MSAIDSTDFATAVDYDPFAGTELARIVPTTESQREIWLAAKLERDASLAYNESVSLDFAGALDVAALQAAFAALTDRHESLRATLGSDGDELHIAAGSNLCWELRDLMPLEQAVRDAEIAATLKRVVQTPFDLEHGPLLRVELLRLSTDRHLLIVTAHHIVCDGWSFGAIVRDLAALYSRAAGNNDGELPAVESFADFALAEAAYADSDACREAENYWVGRFADTPPALDLPADCARPQRRTFRSRREDHTIDAALLADIKRIGAKRGASLYAMLLTGFNLVVGRLTGEVDVVIGIPAAGQAAGGHDGLVGHCVNVLPVRTTIDAQASFHATVDGVRSHLLDAFEHPRYTLGTLLKRLSLPRDPGRMPLVNILFNLDQVLDEDSISFEGLSFEFRSNPRAFENFELFVNAVQIDGQLRLECQYNSDLFAAQTVRRWLDGYETLLRAAVADPNVAAAQLPIVSAAQVDALRQLQPKPTAFDRAASVSDLIVAQARRCPQRVAIRCGAMSWTYDELVKRARCIADALRQRGIERGSLVGVCLERSPQMLAALIGVLEAGGAYVPLDPSYPRERLNFMARDAGLALLVSEADTVAAIDFSPQRTLLLDAPGAIEPAPEIAPGQSGRYDPESIAYVIYTSGSTGEPKGVRVSHRAVVNLLTSMRREPGLDEDDRVLAITTLSFDIAVLELFLPLTVGAEVVLATREQTHDAHALADLLLSSHATVMQATPASWRMLLDTDWQGGPAFKALCGGEALTQDLATRLLQRVGMLWNMYGPTETTVWSSCERVLQPERGISIGQPVANTEIWILDTAQQICPVGVSGEICIGGSGVATGYLDRPELNAERFIAHPLARAGGDVLYRTGDRGRWTAQGVLEHLGRMDFQVKLRGHRIELGEVETTLIAHADVAQAVVIVREDQPGDMRMVAYVVACTETTIDPATLRSHLRDSLPEFMLPQHFVVLDALPLLPNGKIDRKSLRAPGRQAELATTTRIAPRNEIERRIAAAMEKTLALPDVGIDDDFFKLGGHSLLAARLTAMLNEQFGVALSLRSLFDTPSVAGLARTITQARNDSQGNSRRIEARAEQDRAPLSLLQKRLWLFDQLNPGNVVYNTPSAHRLLGKLDEAAFNAAFNDLLRRQPSLRTAIEYDGEEVVQRVHEDVAVALFPAQDLSHLATSEREAELLRRLEILTNSPFDLATVPLFRVHMFRLGPEEHALFFMPHHIIWDGWSFDLFYDEFSVLYAARKDGVAPLLPALEVTYADFSDWHGRWLQGPQYEEQFRKELERWRIRLARHGAPSPLPADKPCKERMCSPGGIEWITLPRSLADALRNLARSADATPFMVLLAVYYAMLWRISGHANLVVGTPVRVRASNELEKVMGLFTNLLPLPIDVDPTIEFPELIRNVRAVVLESFASPDVQLEDLMREPGMRELAGKTHFYQAQFSYQDARDRVCDWGGLAQQQIPLFQRDVSEDLSVWLLENADGMIGGVLYNADLFHAETARLLAQRYVGLLESVVENPDQSIAQLTRAASTELDLMQVWNRTESELPTAPLIHELVETQVDSGPDRVALTSGSWGTSYAEIEQRANRIAACLRTRAVAADTVVGLGGAGVNRIAAMLGILKAGGVCVLLDPEHSADQLADIVADARIRVLVGDSSLAAALNWPRESGLWFDADTSEIIAASTQRHSSSGAISPDTLAFALYAPNASGELQGAAVSHRALANVLAGMRQALGLGAADRIAGSAECAQSMSLLECMLPLSMGAEFIQFSHKEAMGAESIATRLAATAPTVMFASEAVWRLTLSADWSASNRMKAVCAGGALDDRVAAQLSQRCTEVWNLFSTPSAIVATCGRIEQSVRGSHAGRPIANMSAWVLDDDGHACPIGTIGDICVSGVGISEEFGVRAESMPGALPATRAVAARGRLLGTGARGRWLSTGNIEVVDDTELDDTSFKNDVGADTLQRAPEGHLQDVGDAGMDTPESQTAAERMLVRLWRQMLGIQEIRKADNFFDLGGHSLLAVSMAAKVEKRTGVRLNLLKIANSSLRALAAELPAAIPDDVVTSEASTFGKRVRGLFGRGRGTAQ